MANNIKDKSDLIANGRNGLIKFTPGSAILRTVVLPDSSACWKSVSDLDRVAFFNWTNDKENSQQPKRKSGIELVIQITGYDSSSCMSLKDEEIVTLFLERLVKVIEKSDRSWIVTNGLWRGITKLVGEVVGQAGLAHSDKPRGCLLILLGVPPNVDFVKEKLSQSSANAGTGLPTTSSSNNAGVTSNNTFQSKESIGIAMQPVTVSSSGPASPSAATGNLSQSRTDTQSLLQPEDTPSPCRSNVQKSESSKSLKKQVETELHHNLIYDLQDGSQGSNLSTTANDLDPNHSHFLFVKTNGGGETNCDSLLNSAMTAQQPGVHFVIGGSPEKLQSIVEHASHRPIVILRGFEGDVGISNQHPFCQPEINHDLVSEYDISLSSCPSFDNIILQALLKANFFRSDDQIKTMLQLARIWDNSEMAERLLEISEFKNFLKRRTVDNRINPFTKEIFCEAVINGQGEFLSVLENCGIFKIRTFLTPKDICRSIYYEAASKQTDELPRIGDKLSFLGVREINQTTQDNQTRLQIFFSALKTCSPCKSSSDLRTKYRRMGGILAASVGCYLDNLFSEESFVNLYTGATVKKDDGDGVKTVADVAPAIDFTTDRIEESLPNTERSALGAFSEEKAYLTGMRDLYMYSLVINAKLMAQHFWFNGIDRIGSALFGAKFLSNLAEKAERSDFELARQYRSASKEWQETAIEVLNICHQKDPEKTSKLLAASQPTWQNYTLLETGLYAEQQEFMAQTAVHSKRLKLWKTTEPNWGIYSAGFKFWLQSVITMLSLLIFTFSAVKGPSASDAWMIVDIYVAVWVSDTLALNIVETFGEKLLRKRERCQYFLSRLWNWIDLCAIIVVTTIIWCINDPAATCPRIIYSICCVAYWGKALRLLYAFHTFGPKVIAVFKMLWDVLLVALLYIIALIALSVPIGVTMSPTRSGPAYAMASIKETLYARFWHVVGIALEKHDVEKSCLSFHSTFSDNTTESQIFNETMHVSSVFTMSNSSAMSSPVSACAEEGFNYVGVSVYVAFLIIPNIILLNMLIALMAKTLDTVEEQSKVIWSFHMFQITRESFRKSLIPAPLLSSVYCFIVTVIMKKKDDPYLKMEYKHTDRDYLGLSFFERQAAAEFLNRKLEGFVVDCNA